MECKKGMTAEGRVDKVIELIYHEVVNTSKEEVVQLKANGRAQISLSDNKFVDLLNNV